VRQLQPILVQMVEQTTLSHINLAEDVGHVTAFSLCSVLRTV